MAYHEGAPCHRGREHGKGAVARLCSTTAARRRRLWPPQAERWGAQLYTEDVESVDLSARPFTIRGAETTVRAHSVIIATGATAKKLGLPSEQKVGGRAAGTERPLCNGQRRQARSDSWDARVQQQLPADVVLHLLLASSPPAAHALPSPSFKGPVWYSACRRH